MSVLINSKEVDVAGEFKALVLARLPTITDERDRGLIHADIEQKQREGWTVHEVVKILMCTEELNPELVEAVALKRMSEITRAVQVRKNAEAELRS